MDLMNPIKPRNPYASKLAKLRWIGVSPEERTRLAKNAVNARIKKYCQNSPKSQTDTAQ